MKITLDPATNSDTPWVDAKGLMLNVRGHCRTWLLYEVGVITVTNRESTKFNVCRYNNLKDVYEDLVRANGDKKLENVTWLYAGDKINVTL